MSGLAQGDLVIVRTFGARPQLRRVWESSAEGVAIVDEERYQRRLEGLWVPNPIWFPRTHVFAYDPATFPADALGIPQIPAFWDRLTRC